MIGTEVHILPRPLKTHVSASVAWAFPNTYEIGMSSLGYQLVWWLLENNCDLLVRRVFTDTSEPGWQESDLIGFTLSWELDYVNVLRVLGEAQISPLSAERGDDCPLVFAGGPVLTANPEPFADFFDVVLLGDAEAVLPNFLSAWKETRHMKRRQDKLVHLAAVDGVYVPSLYKYDLQSENGPIASITPTGSAPAQPRKMAFAAPPDYVAHSVMLAPDTTFADMFLIEIARSCPQECRFCLASYLTRPFRAANVDTVMEKVDLGLKHTKKIGLLGPSVTEHPQFDSIAKALLARPQTSISVASIRADTISPLVLEMLVGLGQKSVTIALESGSERLRAIMKKNLSEAEIWHAVDMIAASGLQGLKFYGIVGLPGETAQDLDETVRLLSEIKKAHKRLRLTLGLTSFVPKAQTPFQWAGRDRQSKDKLEYVRKRLAARGVDVRPESHNWSDIQAVLSRGDRRLTPLLLKVAADAGNIGAWRRAFRNLPPHCPEKDFYAFRNVPENEFLPWSHLVDSPRSGSLLRHKHQAHELSVSGPGATNAQVGHNTE